MLRGSQTDGSTPCLKVPPHGKQPSWAFVCVSEVREALRRTGSYCQQLGWDVRTCAMYRCEEKLLSIVSQECFVESVYRNNQDGCQEKCLTQ